MAKRIFKVVGIVLTSILGFTGAVVGVMAIMGKFKKPVVYPQQLVFAETEKIIVDNKSYNEDGYSNEIYSFVLNGVGQDGKEVTMKNCLLTINTGSSLIQLCNANGENLTAESNGKYKIQCNENTYFKLKKIEDRIFTTSTYGKVSLRADDEKMMTGTARDQDMVIWVDRAVKSVKIDDSSVSAENKKAIFENDKEIGTEITMGLDEELAFDLISDPVYALNPISKDGYGKKIVEYFYFKQGVTIDWEMIDKTNLTDFPFLTYDEQTDRLTFKANSTSMAGQSYLFKIAVFDTYAHRQEFLAGLQNNPNQTSNLDRLAEMVSTQLQLNVKSTKITDIGSETANIDLSLFENNNNIILNADKDGYKNLRLYMIGAGTRTSLRFDEANFDLRTINLIQGVDDISEFLFKKYTAANFAEGSAAKLTLNSIIGDTFIDFFVYNDQYGSENYQTYRLATKEEFDYEANYITGSYGNERAFNIVAKSIPNIKAGRLVLGIMVVNSTGEYYLTTIDVNVAEKDLNFDFTKDNQSYTLNVDFEEVNGQYETVFETLSFEDIVNINAGSYRGCVFVTPKLADGAKYSVDVCENIKFVKDDKEYVLVGYFEGNKFVNKVRSTANATIEETKLYMLQLKNDYTMQGSENVAEHYINSIVSNNPTGNFTLSAAENAGENVILVNKDYISAGRAVVVKVKFNIAPVLEFLKFEAENTTIDGVVENGVDQVKLVAGFSYSVKLSSDVQNMLAMIFNAEGAEAFKNHFSILTFNKNGASVTNDNMLSIATVELVDADEADENNNNKVIKLTFAINESADSSANNANTYKIQFNYDTQSFNSKLIFVNSNKPANIQLGFKKGDGETVETINVDLNKATLYVTIDGVNETKQYTYNYRLESDNKTLWEGNEFVLNGTQQALTENPSFVMLPNYNENNTISYSINGEEINGSLVGLSVGNYDLVVSTIGNVSRTLAVVVDAVVNPDDETADKYFTYSKPTSNNTLNESVSDKTSYNLNEAVKYKFGETELPELLNISNIRFSFAGSETLTLEEVRDETSSNVSYTLKTNNNTVVLEIARNNDGNWTFTRKAYPNTRLTVTVSVKMDTIADPFDVKIEFTSSRQIDLNKNWTSIYAGTKIQFAESINNGGFNTNALFKIKLTTSETLTYNIYKEINGTYPTSATFTQDNFANGQGSLEVGVYKVEFKLGTGTDAEILATFNNIVVVPNIVVGLNTKDLESEREYDLSASTNKIFDLQQYKTKDAAEVDYVYGLDANSSVIYKDTDLVDFTDFANLKGACSQNDDSSEQNKLVSLVNGKLSVGYIKNLKETRQCEFALKYDDVNIGNFTVNIKSKYTVEDNQKDKFMVVKDDIAEGLSLINGAQKISPTSVSIGGEEPLTGNTYKSHIENEIKVDATYKFTLSGKDYVYIKQITLIPYVPDTKDTKVYSESEFDIINDIFKNATNDSNIKNIYVDRIEIGEKANTTLIITLNGGSVAGVGYRSDLSVTKFTVKVGAIEGSQLTITIFYHIDYIDGETEYNYEHTLTIENYLTIASQYPFDDENATTGDELNLKAIDGKTKDMEYYAQKVFGNEAGNKLTVKNNNVFGFAKGLKFEPVTMGQMINLNADVALNIRRMLVTNNRLKTDVDGAIAGVELVAYQSIQSAKNYVDSGSLVIGRNSITFNNSSTFTGTSVYLLFKVTTDSNNFDYYLVRLQKQSGNFANLELSDESYVKVGEVVGENVTIVPTLDEIKEKSKVTISDKTNIRYYLMGIKNSENNAVGAFENDKIALGDQYKALTAEIMNAPDGFIQIIVAVVYQDSNQIIYLGSWAINIATETGLNIYSEGNKAGLLHKTDTLGHYTAELKDLTKEDGSNAYKVGTAAIEIAKDKDSNNEITGVSGYFALNGDQIVSSNGNKTIVELNGATIKVVSFASKTLTFTVKYHVDNNYYIFVTYTLQGVTVAQISDAIVGTFDKQTGFNTTLDLTPQLGGYAGSLKANDKETGNTLNIDTNEKSKSMNFTQSNATTNTNVKLTFENLIDLTTGKQLIREFKVTVYPAYYVEQTMGTQSTPFVVTNKSDNYSNASGSSVEFSISSTKDGENTLYNSYQIDGLTIYVAAGTYLSIGSINHYNYIVNGDGSAALSANNQVKIGTYKDDDNSQKTNKTINFVHLAQSKTIKMEIGLIDGKGNAISDRNSSNALVIDFYATLPSTYTNLKPQYTVAGSNHDNFKAGSSQENIFNYLFGSVTNIEGLTNQYRLALVRYNAQTGEDEVITGFNAAAMGFYDTNNPNCLTFVLGDGLKIDKNGTDYKMTFDNVSSQISTWFRLTNIAGLESETYNIEILIDEADKLVYKTDDSQTNYLDNHSTWAKNGANQYASIVINDVENNSSYDYSTTSNKNVIAKIYDVRNNVFKLAKYDDVKFNDAADTYATLTFDENKNVYNLTTNHYTITFWANNSGEILFNIERAAGFAVCANIYIPLSIYTNAGKICDFTFNIFNFSSISSTETEYYATETFKLGDLLKLSSATKNQDDTFDDVSNNYKYELVLSKCSYFVAGNKYTLTDADASNDLFNYDDKNLTITLEQVPENVQLTAYIKITKNDILVDVVQRIITIKRNIEFKINGQSAATGSHLETELTLADESIVENNYATFKVKNLTGGADIDGLGLTLNFVKSGTNITIDNNNTKISIASVDVADYMGNKVDEYVSLTGNALTFKRDFTGDITLSLGFKTNFGYYYQYWIIHVTGLQTFNYRYAPTTALLDSGSSFNSGKEISVVSTDYSSNPAIIVRSNLTLDMSGLTYARTLSYKVLTYEEYAQLNMETLIGMEMPEGQKVSQDDCLIKTTLPLVPQSKVDNPVDYYVVYKIVYSYVQDKENQPLVNQPLFAIYRVRNVATINVAPNVETTINVDNSNSKIYNVSGNLLNLFYYKETFKNTAGNEISLIYLSGNKFMINGSTFESATINGNTLTIDNYVFDYSLSTPTLKIGESEDVYTRSNVDKYIDGDAGSMFVCDYPNILRFKDFVDNINYIQINDRQFNTFSNNGDIIAIDLKEFDKTKGQTVLFENTVDTSLAIYAKDSTVALTSVDITLTGNAVISPKGEFMLSQIFQDGSYVTDYSIVGITNGAPNSNWITNANTENAPIVVNDNVSSFTVGENTYTVKQATFIGGGVDGLYQVSQNYYYLVGATQVYAVDYLSYGNSFYFRVQYNEGSASSIDLANAIVCFANDASGKLSATPKTLNSIGAEVSTDGTKVSVEEATLIDYKKNNPTKTTMDIDVTLTSDSISLTAKIKFELPTSV